MYTIWSSKKQKWKTGDRTTTKKWELQANDKTAFSDRVQVGSEGQEKMGGLLTRLRTGKEQAYKKDGDKKETEERFENTYSNRTPIYFKRIVLQSVYSVSTPTPKKGL